MNQSHQLVLIDNQFPSILNTLSQAQLQKPATRIILYSLVQLHYFIFRIATALSYLSHTLKFVNISVLLSHHHNWMIFGDHPFIEQLNSGFLWKWKGRSVDHPPHNPNRECMSHNKNSSYSTKARWMDRSQQRVSHMYCYHLFLLDVSIVSTFQYTVKPSIIISFLSYMNTFINITFLLYQLHTFSIVSIIINHLLFSWWSEYTNAKQITGNTISFSWIIPIDNQDVHTSTCVCNQYNWYAVISTSVQFELESIHSLCSNPTKEQLVARSVLSYLLIVRIHMSIIAMLKVTWLLRISASDTDVMSKWILTWFIPSTTFMTWWRASSCCRGSSWLLNETLLRVFIIIFILWWNLSLWYAYYVRSSFMIPCSWYLTVTCLCWWVCLWGRCCKTYYQ